MMKQHINLAWIIPVEEKIKLRTVSIVKFNAFFLIVLMLVYGYAVIQKQTLDKQLLALQAEQETVQAAMLDSGKKMDSNKTLTDTMAKQIKKLETAVGLRRQVLSILNQPVRLNAKGFSSYLDELGRSIVSNVWLDSINFNGGGGYVKLTGLAFRTDDILSFMQKLYQSHVFGEKKLKLSEMINTEKDPKKAGKEPKMVSFILGTE